MTFPYIKGPGRTAAHPRSCLPLLPSGPDGVHKLGLRWAWPRGSGRSAETAGGPGLKDGGDERIRTADPLVANEVLSQLSYIPNSETEIAARRWARAPPKSAGY